MTTAAIAIGVDGCPGGWIAAIGCAGARDEMPGDGLAARTELRHYGTAVGGLAALVGECQGVGRRGAGAVAMPIVAVDVPMGLPARAGLRACDAAARRMLGPRGQCVFPAPDRELLDRSFEAARAIVLERRRSDPVGANPIMTRQAMAIAPKIAEADALLRADPQCQRWLVEVHPELSFLALAHELGCPEAIGGLPPKKSRSGRALRRRLLAAVFPDSGEQIEAASWARATVGVDDVLDAYAGLWSALRFRRGDRPPGAGPLVLGDGARDERGLLRPVLVLGDGVRDERGLLMRIIV